MSRPAHDNSLLRQLLFYAFRPLYVAAKFLFRLRQPFVLALHLLHLLIDHQLYLLELLILYHLTIHLLNLVRPREVLLVIDDGLTEDLVLGLNDLLKILYQIPYFPFWSLLELGTLLLTRRR